MPLIFLLKLLHFIIYKFYVTWVNMKLEVPYHKVPHIVVPIILVGMKVACTINSVSKRPIR